MLAALREWFASHGYLEVQTPVLVPSGAMEEHLYPIPAADGALRTSPEFALKRVLGSGVGRIYEIGPCLRDREAGPWHRREFTMCEWYRAGASLADAMDEVEALVAAAASALGQPVPSWRRTTIRDCFLAATGMDPAVSSPMELTGIDEPWDDAFLRRWVSDVEPTLVSPTLVSDWPASQSALARTRDTPQWPVACRFEAYLGGVELANAFFELLDPVELRRRFVASNEARMAEGEPPHPVDEALLDAVGRMPRSSGVAMGVDRLVAVLAGFDGITA